MYRDDHDAALARVTALSDELDREHAANTKRDARIRELTSALDEANRELARTKGELTRLRPPTRPAVAPAPYPAVAANPPSRGGPWKHVIVALGTVGLVGAISSKLAKTSSPPIQPVQPQTRALPDEVSALLPEALARGTQALPGGRLISLTANGVDEHGSLHPRYGHLELELERNNPQPPPSPTDPEAPIGAPRPPDPDWERTSCTTITRQGDGTWDGHTSYCFAAADQPAFTPACTMRALWQRALADGARPGALANISWGAPSMYDLMIAVSRADHRSSYRWHFVIDDPRAPYGQTYADDCVPDQAR